MTRGDRPAAALGARRLGFVLLGVLVGFGLLMLVSLGIQEAHDPLREARLAAVRDGLGLLGLSVGLVAWMRLRAVREAAGARPDAVALAPDGEDAMRRTLESLAWQAGGTGWVVLDPEGRVTRISRTAAACFDASVEQIAGGRLEDWLAADGRRLGALLAEPLAPGASARAEGVRLVSYARGTVWIDAVMMRPEQGALRLLLLDDVGRRAADAPLFLGDRERDEVWSRTLTQQAPFGIGLLEEGRVARCNPQFARHWDLDAGRLEGAVLSRMVVPRLSGPEMPRLLGALIGGEAEGGVVRLDAASPRTGARSLQLRSVPIDADRRLLFTADVSAHVREADSLRLAEVVFLNTREGLAVTDAAGLITEANPALAGMLGTVRERLIGRDLRAVLPAPPDEGPDPWRRLETHDEAECELAFGAEAESDGARVLALSLRRVRSVQGDTLNIVACCVDHSERRAAQGRLEELALRDPVTGLANRACMTGHLDHAMRQAAEGRLEGAVLLVDLDRFKNINDSMGHPVGDALLRGVGDRLRARLREGDRVGRWGGDEFIVLLAPVASEAEACERAAGLVASLDEPFRLRTEGGLGGERDIHICASIGIALFPRDAVSTHLLLQQADAAMYQAKAQGRGRWSCYTPSLTMQAQHQFELESRLRTALQRHELRVHYQPLVRTDDGTICGVEALVRWDDPARGSVPPAEFIPLAEDTGLILPLGEWVLDQACAQMAAWREAGCAPGYMAVNLSSLQFRHHRLVEHVQAVLTRHRLPPAMLELEITEGHLLDATTAVERLNRLKALGVRVAIDDFGTGYSSLSYIGRYPIDKLKIDRSFVSGLPDEDVSRAIVEAVVALGRSLGVEVLAEGVETRGQLQCLTRLGVKSAQGWLFAAAEPAGALDARLRDGRLAPGAAPSAVADAACAEACPVI